MGYHIEGPAIGKGQYIVNQFKAVRIPQPASFDEVPDDKALICVVENSVFDAAAVAYDVNEFKAFTLPTDHRPKQFFLMDKETAWKEAGVPPNPRPRRLG